MKKICMFLTVALLSLCVSVKAQNVHCSNLYVSHTGWATWTVDGDAYDYFMVMLADDVVGETKDMAMQIDVESLTVGQTYVAKVAAVSNMVTSDWETCEWVYNPCETYEYAIAGLTAVSNDGSAFVNWTHGAKDVIPVKSNEYTYDFEITMDLTGWTTIDADGDGFNWFNGNLLGTEMGHWETDGWACSESYKYPNVLSPDNYLVSRQFMATSDSRISFWACSHDELYPEEHFGVAISTKGNVNPEDFFTVAEWTIPYTYGKAEGARGEKGQSEWIEYNVDLSKYAGELIYIAIRHFGCTDRYKLDVDDVTIVAAEPAPMSEEWLGVAVFRDGEYIGMTTGNRFMDYEPEPGEHQYCVRAVRNGENDGTYMSMSCPECVDLDVIAGVQEQTVQASVYPNPAQGDVLVEASGMKQVTVFNLMGQSLYSVVASGDRLLIDVSSFENGLYFIRIEGENGTVTRQVVVRR